MELFSLVSTWFSSGRSAGHLLYHHYQILLFYPISVCCRALRLPSLRACSLAALAVQSVPIWARGFLDAGSSDFDLRRRSSSALRLYTKPSTHLISPRMAGKDAMNLFLSGMQRPAFQCSDVYVTLSAGKEGECIRLQPYAMLGFL